MRRVDVTNGPIQRPEPLRASVYRRVVRLLTDGELEPGQTLTEAGLSKTLGVSRTPVREALLQLEAEGVLQSTPARGFTVRDLKATEAEELYPILSALESLAIRSRRGKIDIKHLQRLDQQLANATDPIVRWKLDTAFHEAMVATSHNQSLRDMITRLRVILSRYEIEYMRTAGNQPRHGTGKHHGAIIDAILAGDNDGVTQAIWENWRQSLDAVQTWLNQTK